MQQRGRLLGIRAWGAIGAVAFILASTASIAGAPGSQRHQSGVRRFSLVSVTRPSASRRVIEVSGRAPVPSGVERIGDRLVVEGSSGDDTLIVDFSHGDPVPAGGLTYDGGGNQTRTGNVLVLRGGHFRDAVYDYSSASAGSIHLDGTNISYRNLQPIANSGTAASIVFNLPSGANDASVQNDGTVGNNRSELFSGNGAFETTTFTNPSSSLTINGGGSSDSLALAPVDSFNSADVTIGSEGTVSPDSLTTTGTLRITAGAVSQPSGTLDVGGLGVNADAGISLSGADFIGTLAGSVSAAGAPISVDSIGLSVGTVPAAGSFAGAKGVSTNGGNASLEARSLELNAPVNVGNGQLTIAPPPSTAPVYLGGTGYGALSLPAAALANVNAAVLQVGSPTTGPITIAGPVEASGHFATLSLQTLDNVEATSPGTATEITVPNLAIRSATGIGTSGTLETAVSSLAFSNTRFGDVNVSNSGPLTLGSVDGLTSSSNVNAVALATASDVTIQTPVSTGALRITCGTAGAGCTFNDPAGGLTGSPVLLAGGPGINEFNVTGESLGGAGPLEIDGGSSGRDLAAISGVSVTGSPDAGLVLDRLQRATVTGSTFKDNAQDGVLIENTSGGMIGGSGAGLPDTISGNGGDGIRMVSGSGVGFSENSIFGNAGLGIGLEAGANHGQTAPMLTLAVPVGTSTRVTGTLHGAPNRSFLLQFFDNPACDASGFAEGQTFIGSATVPTDGTGNATFGETVPGSSSLNDAITATATDQTTGDSSEFSSCLRRSAPTVAITTPANGATYKLDQLLSSRFTCADGVDGPGIASCSDQTGQPSGALLDTASPGHHTFKVTAASLDGQTTSQTVTYTVSQPNNRFKTSHKKLDQRTGVVTFKVAVPGAGTVKAVETMISAGRQFVAGRTQVRPHGKKTVRLKIKPNGRGTHVVRHHKQLVSLQVVVTFTPAGGSPHSMRFALALR